jgi:hypothetical protein
MRMAIARIQPVRTREDGKLRFGSLGGMLWRHAGKTTDCEFRSERLETTTSIRRFSHSRCSATRCQVGTTIKVKQRIFKTPIQDGRIVRVWKLWRWVFCRIKYGGRLRQREDDNEAQRSVDDPQYSSGRPEDTGAGESV